MPRPKTSAFVGVSLDGFLARPDGSVDWLDPFHGEENGYTAFFASVDTLVIGRKTYDFVQGLTRPGEPWLYAGKRCVVMTHRPVSGANGERAHAGQPGPLLETLGVEGARHVYVDGGAIIRSFLAANLLDELTATFVPVLIGEGLPLFGGVTTALPLTLEQTRTLSKGMVQLRYRISPPSRPA
jgi:dihydrofolate reductase